MSQTIFGSLTTAAPQPVAAKTIDIPTNNVVDPDGNVVFLVGPELKSRLQVSAKTMSLASDVFKILLAPKFAEGTELQDKGIVTIPLPGDNAAALGKLCAIFHLRTELVPVDELTEADFLELAILVDKYNCYNAISIWLKYCFMVNNCLLQQTTTSFQELGNDVTKLSNWIYVLKVFREEEPWASGMVQGLVNDLASGHAQNAAFRRLPQNMHDNIVKKRNDIIRMALNEVREVLQAQRSCTITSSGHARLQTMTLPPIRSFFGSSADIGSLPGPSANTSSAPVTTNFFTPPASASLFTPPQSANPFSAQGNASPWADFGNIDSQSGVSAITNKNKKTHPSHPSEVRNVLIYGALTVSLETELGCPFYALKWRGSIRDLCARLDATQKSISILITPLTLLYKAPGATGFGDKEYAVAPVSIFAATLARVNKSVEGFTSSSSPKIAPQLATISTSLFAGFAGFSTPVV